MIDEPCDLCGAPLEAPDLTRYGDTFLAHVRSAHADLPYPDHAVRNYGEGLARTTGGTERLPQIGAVEVHPVTEDRIDDWLHLFDHDVFAGFPQWSACYCAEPHVDPRAAGEHWQATRAMMIENLRGGVTFGYLAYVDGYPAGWVNASRRCDYGLYRRGDDDDPVTIGISCFAVAPPYRGHGLAKAFLDRVVADASSRDAAWVEAYPFNDNRGNDNPDFRGPRHLYDERDFTEVEVRARDCVVRRPV